MKLTIIIPVYNVEQYIRKCLDSILSQPFTDYEIICVDDASTDNSLKILKEYESSKIKIIALNQNGGSGVARNVAQDMAQGEYLWFVDADDWLEDDCHLEELIQTADNANADITIFGGKSCYIKKDGTYSKRFGAYSTDKLPKKYLNKVFSSNQIKKDIFKFPSTTWTKLYRRQFLIDKNIRQQENIKVGEDQITFFHSMTMADRITLFPKNLYCYRKNRAGSAMTVKKKKNFSPIFVFYAVEDLLKDLDRLEEYKNIFINRYFSKATSWLGKFQDDLKPEYYKEYTKLLEHVKQEYPNGWWLYFKPDIKDGYKMLKFKKLLANCIYHIKHN